MTTRRAKRQPGEVFKPLPFWARLLSLVCVALLAVVSTAQVCHSHDERVWLDVGSSLSLSDGHTSAHATLPESPLPDSSSAVNCPLCVAMHSALPVTHSLVRVEMLRATQVAIAVEMAKLLFPWRFDLASRPPPAAGVLATFPAAGFSSSIRVL